MVLLHLLPLLVFNSYPDKVPQWYAAQVSDTTMFDSSTKAGNKI